MSNFDKRFEELVVSDGWELTLRSGYKKKFMAVFKRTECWDCGDIEIEIYADGEPEQVVIRLQEASDYAFKTAAEVSDVIMEIRDMLNKLVKELGE